MRRPNLAVPAWSRDAIWYQIFVERFRNGDPSNDPTPHDIEGVTDEPPPDGWQPTPGPGLVSAGALGPATGKDFYGTVQSRRYGGDLQGVMDRLDYLQDLGVTALYFNPVNDAPSLHKYDARNYHHIDRNFGPDPRGDEARMAAEDPPDPATWSWTAADSLFLALVREVHRRGMRIIMDYSWNHTGITFWAWRDVLANQRASRFADWYEIERFDDPATPDTSEFAYQGMGRVCRGSRSGRRSAGRRGRPTARSRATSSRRPRPRVQCHPALAGPQRGRRSVGWRGRLPARRGRDGAARLLARLPALRPEHQSGGVPRRRGVVGDMAGQDLRPGAVACGAMCSTR